MNVSSFIAKRYLFAKKSRNIINIISFISFFGLLVSSAALVIILSGFNGIQFFDIFRIGEFAVNTYQGIFSIIILLAIVFYFPNTQDFIFNENRSTFNAENKMLRKNKNIFVKWKPQKIWGLIFALAFIFSIMFVSNTNEFLYFEF